ncbi:MAG: TatD family hydrolase [Cyclobacteriaceae bacterium]
MLIDSHAHIYSEEFKANLPNVIDRAKEVGVSKIFMPNIDHESIDSMMQVAHDYPDYCIPMMGLHPCYVKKDFEKELYEVESLLKSESFCAVGEIGTDLYWDKSLFKYQQEAFKIQCELAIAHDLPVVIHCRESIDETIELVKPYFDQGLHGVFHCFTGTLSQANQITNLGFKLGIGGVATFKNGGLQPVLENVDLEHLLLETDCPYLAPTPHRGKRNEPAFVKLVAEKIAEVREVDVEKIGDITSKNSLELFSRS